MSSTPAAPHPSGLWDGFWGIQLLHTGQSLGLFEALSQPLSSGELAEKLHLEARYTAVWCAAAEAHGLLRESGGRYGTPPELRQWLTDSRGFTESHLHLSGRLNETFQAVFAGRALPEPPIGLRLMLSESLLQNYRWMFQTLPEQLPNFAAALQNGSRLLEVGCGLGLGLGVLRARLPHLELYGLEADFECAREAERSTRAVIHLGELPGDRYGKSFDLVVCFRALALSGQPERLLAECAGLLSPGGWLVLGTELQDRDGQRKSSARSLGELFAYRLLAGETEVNFFYREQLLEILDGLNLTLEAEVEAPDWGTPLFLCSRSRTNDPA